MQMQSGGGKMTRKNSTTTLAVVGAFVLVAILSYYSWSLTSENRTLKRLVVNTYSKLKDMTSHKGMMEKKNTLLSNRMVEMEEQRNAEKQNAETEQAERQKCTAKLEELKGDCETNSNKVKQCEDASLHRENNLLKLLKDVELDNVDSDAEKDIFGAKIRYLKDKLKTLGKDFRSLQDRYSELEKKKIGLDENMLVLDMKLKQCQKQKIVYVDKQQNITSEKTQEETEEDKEEIEKPEHGPKKDKKAMKKQAEDAISNSKLKTNTSPVSASRSSKLVTDAVITVPVIDEGEEAENSASKSSTKVVEEKGKGHISKPKKSADKNKSEKSSAEKSNSVSKSKSSKPLHAKHSKKAKSELKSTPSLKEKDKGKVKEKEVIPSAKTTKVAKTTKLSSSKDGGEDIKTKNGGVKPAKDKREKQLEKKLEKSEDSDIDVTEEGVDFGSKKPEDASEGLVGNADALKKKKSGLTVKSSEGSRKEKVEKKLENTQDSDTDVAAKESDLGSKKSKKGSNDLFDSELQNDEEIEDLSVNGNVDSEDKKHKTKKDLDESNEEFDDNKISKNVDDAFNALKQDGMV